jgi:hypothetical protein
MPLLSRLEGPWDRNHKGSRSATSRGVGKNRDGDEGARVLVHDDREDNGEEGGAAVDPIAGGSGDDPP